MSFSHRYLTRNRPTTTASTPISSQTHVNPLGPPPEGRQAASDLSELSATPTVARASYLPSAAASAASTPGLVNEPETYTNTHGYDSGSNIQDTPGREFNNNYYEPFPRSTSDSTAAGENDSQHPPQTPNQFDRPENLSSEQAKIIELAREAMTSAQRDLVDKRNAGVRVQEQPVENREEGSSRGKGVDPRNWGAAGIPEEELNPEAQKALIEEYNAFKLFKLARENEAKTEKISTKSLNSNPVDEPEVDETVIRESHIWEIAVNYQ